MARIKVFAIFIVLFFTGSGTCMLAQQVRAHRRPAAQSISHRKASNIPPHNAHRAASRGPRRSVSTYSARRRPIRRGGTLVNARMPIRHYAWMRNGSASPARLVRTPQTLRAASSAADEAESTEAPRAPVAEDLDTDASTESTAGAAPTAEDAANKIADAEAPVTPHAAHAAIAAASRAPRPEIALSTPTVASIPLRNTRIVAMAPLRGSLESLMRQNEKTDADNLERIENDADLHERIAQGLLVPVPVSGGLTINSNLPADRRYCRPWTATFLADLARDHQAQFHHSFEVSSAVRTVEYQRQLMRVNGNAAPAEGDIASPHLTGATIDIAKSGLSRNEIFWMRDRLNALQNQGKIDVEEEFRQACFHITVYKSYVGAGPLHKPRHHAAPGPADGADSPAAPAGDPTSGL
jgi:hypothetical protein